MPGLAPLFPASQEEAFGILEMVAVDHAAQDALGRNSLPIVGHQRPISPCGMTIEMGIFSTLYCQGQ